MPIGAQAVGADPGIASVVLGPSNAEPIAQAVELLGIDRIDGKAPIQQAIDDWAVRHFDRGGNRTGVAGDGENPVTLRGQTGAAMRKLAFSRDRALCIQNASLVLLGSPIDSDEPKNLLLGHRRFPLRQKYGQPRRLPILYWRSKARTSYWESAVANPPGHTSIVGARGTGSRKVAPGGSARAVSLISKATGRPRNGTGSRK